nr:XisI protein [Armatimonas sp.]
MVALDKKRRIIKEVLGYYASIPYSTPDAQLTPLAVFDDHNDHYLLVTIGWQARHRYHNTVVHLDIIDGKIWLQKDNTDAVIAERLVEAGIPRTEIVLGFQPENVRPYTDYAAA